MAIKFEKAQKTNTSSPIDESQSFVMRTDRISNDLLTKYMTDIYEDPLASAIRETISNAFDAVGKNRETGDVIVSVGDVGIIENDEHKWIEVKDAGCGMTKDELVETYAQYGVSTKRDDKSAIGAFGLGAKSPLAATTEMHIITEHDGKILFLLAYRTQDEHFIADFPLEIDAASEKAEAKWLRDAKTKRVIPGSLTLVTYDDDASTKSDETPENSNELDTSEQETEEVRVLFHHDSEDLRTSGTIVRFPIESKDDKSNEGKGKGLSKTERVGCFLDCIDRIEFGCGNPVISKNALLRDNLRDEHRYFHVSSFSMEDEDGKEIEVKLLLAQSTIGTWFSTPFYKIIKAFEYAIANKNQWNENQCGENQCSEKDRGRKQKESEDGHEDTECLLTLSEREDIINNLAFKVGCWLYPANGKKWSDEIESGSFPIIVEVPSCALPFLPSRDSIINGEENENVQAIVNEIVHKLIDFLSVPENVSRILNWCADSTSLYMRQTFDSIACCIFGYDSAIEYDGGNEMHFGSYTVDATLLEGYADMTIKELEDTPRLLFGTVTKEIGGTAFHKGFIVGPSSNAGMLVGGGMPIKTNTNLWRFKDDEPRVESCLYRCPNFELAAQKGFAKNLHANGITGTPKVTFKRKSTNMTCKDALGDDTHACASYPCGLAIWRLGLHRGKDLLLIDASKEDLSRLSTKIENIVDEMRLLENKSTGAELTYALIPPKDDAKTPWSENEIDEICALIGKLCKKEATFVSAKTLAKTSRKRIADDSVKKQKETNVIDRMTEDASVLTIKRENKDKIKIQNVTRQMTQKAREILNESPESVGVIILPNKISEKKILGSDITKAALALDILPKQIEFIIINEQSKFSKNAAKILLDKKSYLIYDHNFKGKTKSLLDGIFHLRARHHHLTEKPMLDASDIDIVLDFEDEDQNENYSDYSMGRNKHQKEIIECFDEDSGAGGNGGNYENNYESRNDGTNEDTNDGKAIDDEAILLNVKNKIADWKKRLNAYEFRCAIASEIVNGLPHVGTFGLQAFLVEWVSTVTFGRDLLEEKGDPFEDIKPWKKTYFPILNVKAQPFDSEQLSLLVRLRDCIHIWRYYLEDSGLLLDSDTNISKLNSYERLGELLGINDIIDAYYKGIPIEDLMRGQKGWRKSIVDDA